MGLDTLKDVLAVIGGVSLFVGPLLLAWLTLRIHKAVPYAPAFIELKAEVAKTRQWQDDHADDVKLVPKLAAILERVEDTLNRLVTKLDG